MSAFTTTKKEKNYCFGEPCNNALNTGVCANLHQNHPMCGPLAWKRDNDVKIHDEDIKPPLFLVRQCKPSCWAYGHKVLLACNGKIKDIVVDKHTSYAANDKILGYWHYLIMNYYNNKNILQPCHVSIYIAGELNINGDTSDYVLRNPSCIKKKEFVDEDTIKSLVQSYP